MTTRILLTRGLSNVQNAIDLIHHTMAPGEFHLGATYATEYTPLRSLADSFYVEPPDQGSDAYIEWLLTLCRQQDFEWIWPQSRWSAFLSQQDRFAAAGLRLILPCPDADTLETLQEKSRANERLAAVGVPLPETSTINDSAGLTEILATLDDRPRRICVKPVRSIYGLGFRLIDDSRAPLQRFLANDNFAISGAEFRRLLDLTEKPPSFLVMEYLAGDERSMDCLAYQGRLIRAIVRRKPADSHWRWQIIEENADAWEIARRAVAAFQLHGLVNVQTRERLREPGGPEQCFLEVNPRMSGGIYLSCQSGLNLPYWLLRLVTGTVAEDEIPWPTVGLRVAKIERAVTL